MLEFAMVCLWREKWRHSMTFGLYGVLVFLLGSALLLTAALRHEAVSLLARAPALTVQRTSAGRHDWIPLAYGEAIGTIRGVHRVSPRRWGYYYDPPPGATYTIMGVDDLPLTGAQLKVGRGYGAGVPCPCVIGSGIAEVRMLEPSGLLPVKGSDGTLHALRVTDVFSEASALLTHDTICVPSEAWHRIFGVPAGFATDLAVQVPNAQEADTVARKILERLPDVRVIGRANLLKTYEAIFDWRSSLVMLALGGAAAAFGIVCGDRATGVSPEERGRLAVLKAIGWNVSDILKLRVWEGLGLSLMAFLTGILAAHVHVFFLGGTLLVPLLRGWSVLFPELRLQPHGEAQQWAIVFLLTVVPYVLATLVPAWTAATREPDRILRQ